MYLLLDPYLSILVLQRGGWGRALSRFYFGGEGRDRHPQVEKKKNLPLNLENFLQLPGAGGDVSGKPRPTPWIHPSEVYKLFTPLII